MCSFPVCEVSSLEHPASATAAHNITDWNKTNRLSGVINIIIGILIIINAAMGLFNIFYSLLVAVLIGTLIPLGYSYFLHVKKGL